MSTMTEEHPSVLSTLNNEKAIAFEPSEPVYKGTKKDLAFWAVMISLCIITFLSALDLTAVSNACVLSLSLCFLISMII